MENQTDWSTLAEKQWNEKAKDWNKNSENMWEHGSRKEILPFFQKHISKNTSVLDVGCGSGYSTNRLHEAGYQAAGMDLSSDMLSLAQKQYPNLSFTQGDVNQLPFPATTFDSLFMINVLEWTETPIIALREIHRVIKGTGHLCIGILGPTAGPRRYSYNRLFGERVMMNTMMPWEFEQMALNTGFTRVDGFGVPKQWGSDAHRNLPIEAQQALAFMWIFLLQKN